jgi:Tol biopolymer transport system component
MSAAEAKDDNEPDGELADPTRSCEGRLLGPGAQIGSFRIEQELGRGGAGVVYLAQDTKLDRSVAIKSLPPEVKDNPKALSRFTREARVLASLNHPNIATIYDELEEAQGLTYLVLEYVPGQTLAERIAKGSLKLEEALTIALQIAEAVAAAHEHDVIHRDLKPGNIKITQEGKVKVLDFGLAKVVGGEATNQQTTITELGRVIGTPAYMSPEQARGKPTDKRCDIWSFGCVLYEMLTGRVPFEGETVSDTLANVLQKEPDWRALSQDVSANIRVLLRRCLEKDPCRRLQHIGDAQIEISETLSATVEAFHPPGGVAGIPRQFRRNMILVALACLTAGALIACAVLASLVRPSPPEPPVVLRSEIHLPPDKLLSVRGTPQRFLALSPDGTRLVYVGVLENRTSQLYTRSMDDLEIRPIPGTQGAHNPFFSPDGRWVGFFTSDSLKKVSVGGGEPLLVLEDIPWAACVFASWADDDTIVFAEGGPLQRISASGGTAAAKTLVALDAGDSQAYCRYPQVLPGGKAILYANGSRIEAFLPGEGEQRTVLDSATYAQYVMSGHLIFLRDNVLMAAPFDIDRLKRTGPSVPLADDVRLDWGLRIPQIAVSRNGTVVYACGPEFADTGLVWMDRQGVPKPLAAPARPYWAPRLSPDGRHIAVTVRLSDGGLRSQVHLLDLLRGALTHVTAEGHNELPQWSPDGKRLAFWSRKSEERGVYWKVLDSIAPEELLATSPSPQRGLLPCSWSPDGTHLVCTVQDVDTQDDIWLLPLDGDRKPQPFLKTPDREYNPSFAPDSHWMAYVSEESGRPEIYLIQYPDRGRRIPVTTEGGMAPVWSCDGKTLYYTNNNNMMSVPITLDPDVSIGKPQVLFDVTEYDVGGNLAVCYDVSDDERFLMVGRRDVPSARLICVQNWFEELKRIAPVKQK